MNMLQSPKENHCSWLPLLVYLEQWVSTICYPIVEIRIWEIKTVESVLSITYNLLDIDGMKLWDVINYQDKDPNVGHINRVSYQIYILDFSQ